MCQQWKKYFYLISGTAVIIEPAGRTHDLNHSGSVEKKASTSQDINEGCWLHKIQKRACNVFLQAKLVPYRCYHLWARFRNRGLPTYLWVHVVTSHRRCGQNQIRLIGKVCSHIQEIGIWLSVTVSVRLCCAKINVYALVMFISHGEIQMVVLQCHQWSIKFYVCCLFCLGLKGSSEKLQYHHI